MHSVSLSAGTIGRVVIVPVPSNNYELFSIALKFLMVDVRVLIEYALTVVQTA